MNRGELHQRFMAFKGAYHGDTFGPMAVGVRSICSDVFQTLLFEVDFCPHPATWDGDKEALVSLKLLAQKEPVYTQMEVWHQHHSTELANRSPQLNKLRISGTIAAIDINNR